MGMSPGYEEMARDVIKEAQEALATQAAQPAGGGGGAGEADPGVFVIDPKWKTDAQLVRFEQLVEQEQWAKALKIGDFVLDDLPLSEPRLRSNVCCRQVVCHLRRCSRPRPVGSATRPEAPSRRTMTRRRSGSLPPPPLRAWPTCCASTWGRGARSSDCRSAAGAVRAGALGHSRHAGRVPRGAKAGRAGAAEGAPGEEGGFQLRVGVEQARRRAL